MPTIGGVFIPDNLAPTLSAPATSRPGLGAVLSSAAQGAFGQLRYGLPYQYERMVETLSPADEAFYQRGLADTARAAAAAAPASVSDLTSGRAGIGSFVAENLAASLPYMVGGTIGALAGSRAGPSGALAGAILGGTPQFSGSNVARAVETEGSLSQEAAVRSLVAAPFQSASDFAIARFLPGAGHILGEAAATQSGNFLRRTATSIAKAGATEAVTEAGQQVGERFAAGLPLTTSGAAAEYVNAAVTAFAVGGALGAGGGFRRTPAISRPADQVTNEDMEQRVDGALDGSLRAASEQQMGLPLAGGQAVEQQPGLPFASPTAVEEVPASALPQLPLNPGLSNVAPKTQLELGQRFQDDVQPTPPLEIGPELQRFLASIGNQPQPNVPLGSQASMGAMQRALSNGPVQTDPVEATQAPRLFGDQSFDDLQTALRTKSASPELRATAEAEVEARRQEAIGEALLTIDNYQQRVDELKTGLRGGWVQQLEASDPADLRNKVYTEVFENQNTASNVQRFAQRAGLLDADLNPTPAAAAIEAERTAALRAEAQVAATPAPAPASSVPAVAAAVTPDFATQMDALVKDAGVDVTRLPAPIRDAGNMEAARAQVFRMLADDKVAPRGAEASRLERIARKMELITDDEHMDITDAGRKAWLSTPEGAVEANAAAKQQGYAGAQETIFDRGVRAEVSGQSPETFTSVADMAAYEAGKVWAADFVKTPTTKTAAQSNAIAYRKGIGKAKGSAAEPVAAPAPTRVPLTPQQIQQQTLNRIVDAADLRTAADSDVAALRRMVREGATADEVEAALKQVQGGQTLFRQAVPVPATMSAKPTRGQPVFKEMNIKPDTPARSKQRVETETAVRAYRMRDMVELAREEGSITAVRAAKMHDLLDEGKADQVERLMMIIALANERSQAASQTRGSDSVTDLDRILNQRGPPERVVYGPVNVSETIHPDDAGRAPPAQGLAAGKGMDERELARYQRRFWQGKEAKSGAAGRSLQERSTLGGADIQLEQFLAGKTFLEAAQHMADHAPSAYHREIMTRVLGMAKEIEKAEGHRLEIKIARPGDVTPNALKNPDVRAYTRITKVPARATVWLKSADMGPEHGMNYQLAAHEMLHAVTMEALDYAAEVDPDGGTKLGQGARDLNTLATAIRRHLDARINDDSGRTELTDFELAYAARTNNAFDDPHEILAWGLTNPEMQRYLQSIEYKPRQSVFSRLVDLVRGLLGLDGKYDTALTELLRVSEQVLGTKARELAPVFARSDPDGFAESALEANASETGTGAANRTVEAANEVTQQVAGMASQVADRVNLPDLAAKVRRVVLGWTSRNQIDRQYGAQMPGLVMHSDAHRSRGAVLGRFDNMGMEARQNYDRLLRENEPQARWVSQLMETATAYQLDPDKAFEDHDHLNLFELDVQGRKVVRDKMQAEVARLRPLYNSVVKMRNDLSRGDKAGIKVFNDFRALNDAQNYARLAADLHSTIARDPELALGVNDSEINPVDQFMTQEGLSAPGDVKAYWQQALQRQIAATLEFVERKKGEAAQGSESDQRGMAQHLSPIEAQVMATNEALARMARAPYFHLGRFGDNYGTATMRTLPDGSVDPVAQARVAAALEKAGFSKVRISGDNTKPKFSMRFDTIQQTNQFKELMLKLAQDGTVAEDSVQAGPRERRNNYGANEALPDHIQRLIQAIESSAAYTPGDDATVQEREALHRRREAAMRTAVDAWLETQPDSSISKVLAKRYTVAGYDPDMIRSFAHRWHVGSLNIANLATQPKFNRAFMEMRAQINDATMAKNGKDPNVLVDLFNEIKQRDARFPLNEKTDGFDKLRAFSHAYFLGFSPAYGMINLTQLGVTALPELAKQHGYRKSFHAMRRASPKAFSVIKAATAQAVGLGPKHYGEVTLTESVLKAAGLSERDANFVRHMIATGTLDIGTSARALGQLAEHGEVTTLDTALKYAGAVGLYTEVFSRMVTALAAHELHGGEVAESAKYASNVVSNSMFDYQSWNTARQLGKQGFAGPITPLLTQFMSYSVQVTEKLYSETIDAVGRQRTDETATEAAVRKAGARRFLAGHLTAVTALAGTLGLPFATVFATVLERLVDAVDGDDDPFDVTASWRGFLAGVLGKDVAEVVSRGLPRALGFDISQRAGEQNLLPFSEFLSDKRSWRDAVESSVGKSIGAAPSMLLNIADAGERFGNGDVIGGMKAVLPVAFKGPTEAVFRMGSEGYIDTKGNKLPMTPRASAFLWQLLGFTPSERAEYSEARGDQQARRGEIGREATVLRMRIVKAMISGDQDSARSLIERAQEFDRDNPAFAIIPSLAGSLERQIQSRTRAQALRSPLGVGINDIAGQRLTGYANVDYAR